MPSAARREEVLSVGHPVEAECPRVRVELLPAHLKERTLPLGQAAPREGDFVVYWMRTAMRATENPALDVALLAARALDKPVFVYQGLSEHYRCASDRHHAFILE